ncbi:MAG: protein-glutamate O-methyltransferase CheR [Deltaproteobacteria bacterium]|nr:protein-glutamate O-methyltransferase CheR [Deltaproteobacteria bacterium]
MRIPTPTLAPALPLSPQVFSILSSLVAERAGLHFDTTHLSTFADKVSIRVYESGFTSFIDYYYFLRYDPAGEAELQDLVEALVIGETYLFRELAPLETLVSRFVVPAIGCGRRVRIWCAACATGEEPHTLALILASRGILDEVEIVGSDINRTALARARQGRFTHRALRQEVPAFAAPWLQVTEDRVIVRPNLTKAIDWRHINLMDDATIATMGSFDVVVCRNVFIYFNDQTVRRIVARLSASLRRGGALFVGVSESLLRLGTSLGCEEQDGVFFYRKAA